MRLLAQCGGYERRIMQQVQCDQTSAAAPGAVLAAARAAILLARLHHDAGQPGGPGSHIGKDLVGRALPLGPHDLHDLPFRLRDTRDLLHDA